MIADQRGIEDFSFLHTLAKRHRGTMNPGNSISPNSRAWRGLYKAALFEVDKTRLPDRIAQAEKALALRARELFYAAGDNIEEEQALDDTMYALHSLRNRPQTYRSIEAA